MVPPHQRKRNRGCLQVGFRPKGGGRGSTLQSALEGPAHRSRFFGTVSHELMPSIFNLQPELNPVEQQPTDEFVHLPRLLIAFAVQTHYPWLSLDTHFQRIELKFVVYLFPGHHYPLPYYRGNSMKGVSL